MSPTFHAYNNRPRGDGIGRPNACAVSIRPQRLNRPLLLRLHLVQHVELRNAIATHQATTAAETQATTWSDTPLTADCHTSTVKIDGQSMTITLRKA